VHTRRGDFIELNYASTSDFIALSLSFVLNATQVRARDAQNVLVLSSQNILSFWYLDFEFWV
jgi:hypothetical protein